MTENETKQSKNRAVLVGLNAHCLSAEGLDIRGNDPEAILRAAEDRAAALAEALSD